MGALPLRGSGQCLFAELSRFLGHELPARWFGSAGHVAATLVDRVRRCLMRASHVVKCCE